MNKRVSPKIGKQVEGKKPQDPLPADNKPHDSSALDDEHEALLRQLHAVLGIDGARLAAGLICQIVTFCSNGAHFNNERCKFVVASLVTGKPRNHVQAMLIQQQAIMHILYMKYAKLALDPDNPAQAELVVGILSKIARLFLSQSEALHRSQEGPIVEEVIKGVQEPAPVGPERPKGSPQDADGTRVVGSDASVVPAKEGTALPRLRIRPVNGK